ncbi:MAG: restriction endonuclease [Roseovarius sp.]|nr:restriction endonuclease [Roseovarius sp.]
MTTAEIERKDYLTAYLDKCSEDELIEEVLLPLFRQLGFSRITSTGHKDKALEYGKDVWMKFTLPTFHVLYFGIQAKKGKLDASGVSTSNISEIHNQVNMMLGHEIFDPELNRRVLVDHAFIVAGGEITKAARNWLGNKLDGAKRSQIMFMDREDILNLFIVTNLPLPKGALPSPPRVHGFEDEIPF